MVSVTRRSGDDRLQVPIAHGAEYSPRAGGDLQCDNPAMIARFTRALAAGVVIAMVLQESVWWGMDRIDPARSLNAAFVLGPLGRGWPVPLAVSWLLGGLAGGMMATLVGGSRWHGHALGLVLGPAAAVLLHLAWRDTGAFLLLALTPVLATALGAGLAGRALPREPRGLAPSVVTLRGFR